MVAVATKRTSANFYGLNVSTNQRQFQEYDLVKLNVQAELTDIEVKVLTVARYYFMTFANPSKQTWLHANDYAIRHFSPSDGPYASLAVLSAVQTMRRARNSTFLFNDADCKTCSNYLTENERSFLAAIRCKAKGNDNGAIGHAFVLCEGNNAGEFLHAIEILSAVCFR